MDSAVTAPGWLRLRDAVARYHVSRGTLANWARDGLIGRTAVGRCVFVSATDIADLLAAGAHRRTVVPVLTPTPAPAAPTGAYDWRTDDFWTGGTAAPPAAPAARQRNGRQG